MNKLMQKIAVLGLMVLGFWMIPSAANAQSEQIIDTGTVIPNMAFTDIKGNTTYLYDYLGQGYMVVLDLSLTTCTICWQYHTMGLLEILYKKYGPKGTVLPKKMMPIFMECNPATTSDDLHGRGRNTVGDWVSGVNYPIVDLTQERKAATIDKFFKTTAPFPTPTFLIICPDGKLIYTQQGFDQNFDEALLVKLMKGRCAAGVLTTGTEDLLPASSIKVYPNPASDMLYIESEEAVHVSISTIEGRTILTRNDAKNISLSGLTKGIYLLRITDRDGHLIKTEKLLKH